MVLKISKVGINLIKEFEGCYLTAYQCSADVWTIGIGHTGLVDGKAIHKGMTITRQQAEDLLSEYLEKRYEPAVRSLGVELNQNQYDALVSFCYNLGPGIFTGNLLMAIKAKNWTSVGEQMLLYNKAKVKGVLTPVAGLTRRRKAEKDLFLTPVKVTIEVDQQLADAVSKIIRSGININFNSWKRTDLINLNNVPSLLAKLGGIDRLVADRVIGDNQLWLTRQYNVNHVRSLLIKYANQLG